MRTTAKCRVGRTHDERGPKAKSVAKFSKAGMIHLLLRPLFNQRLIGMEALFCGATEFVHVRYIVTGVIGLAKGSHANLLYANADFSLPLILEFNKSTVKAMLCKE